APASAPVRAAAPARPASVPAPQPQEESLLSTITDSPFVLPGIGVLVALIGGFAFWKKRQGKRSFSGETSFIESKIQPDSFFGASGGQRVDTRDGGNSSSASSSLNYSLSQLDAIGDVDPVAEADVYLAYGRDLQAEEILKEAQRSDPDRLAIRTKLLEVYAKRADLKTFETQARQLQALTGGRGEDWAKAQELGRQIDPTNPLYQEGSEISMADTEPAALTPLVPHDDAEQTLMRPPTHPATEQPTPTDFSTTDLPIDFDGDHEPTTTRQGFESTAEVPMEHAAPAPVPAVEEVPFEVSDFDLGTEPVELAAPAPAARNEHLQDVSVSPPPSIDFDFGDLSLDLDKPAAAAAVEHAPAVEHASDLPELEMPAAAADSEPMARKIELADEFRRIGDHEGARELLEEVVSKADGPLKSRAQTMLDALG
ncbi:MAG TPA: FimV/HubP family polar landmark protein, partial [Burkholderiaceae bacterium]